MWSVSYEVTDSHLSTGAPVQMWPCRMTFGWGSAALRNKWNLWMRFFVEMYSDGYTR